MALQKNADNQAKHRFFITIFFGTLFHTFAFQARQHRRYAKLIPKRLFINELGMLGWSVYNRLDFSPFPDTEAKDGAGLIPNTLLKMSR